jgi:hypothetical protein
MKLKENFSETTEPISTKLCFGHLMKFLFLVMAAILDTGRR